MKYFIFFKLSKLIIWDFILNHLLQFSHPEKKNFKLILSDLVGFSVFVFLQTYRDDLSTFTVFFFKLEYSCFSFKGLCLFTTFLFLSFLTIHIYIYSISLAENLGSRYNHCVNVFIIITTNDIACIFPSLLPKVNK